MATNRTIRNCLHSSSICPRFTITILIFIQTLDVRLYISSQFTAPFHCHHKSFGPNNKITKQNHLFYQLGVAFLFTQQVLLYYCHCKTPEARTQIVGPGHLKGMALSHSNPWSLIFVPTTCLLAYAISCQNSLQYTLLLLNCFLCSLTPALIVLAALKAGFVSNTISHVTLNQL